MKHLVTLLLLSLGLQINAQMTLSGTATGDCNCYTLTTGLSQAGSVWSPETIDLTNPFDFSFVVGLGAWDGGADGMVFVLRQTGTSTGGLGSLLGYGGIDNSIGIEIDTWNSTPGEVINDIGPDHIGMNLDGSLNHDLVAPIAIPNIEDGADHDFRVVWDPVLFQMEVFLDGASIFVHTEDLVTTVFGGDPNVFFGWTGATGGASNVQTVCTVLEAGLEVSDVDVCPGQEVDFTSLATSGLIYNGNEFSEIFWAFGDGTTSSEENPTHIYTVEGAETAGIIVTDLLGCSEDFTVSINVDSIDAEITHTDISCFGADDGTGLVTPLSGDAPHTFLWDDPLAHTTALIENLAPGIYNVMVTDAQGCQREESITILEPDELVLDSIVIASATCGLEDGELIFYPSGGTMPYSYSIDGGLTFSDDSLFPDLAAGGFAYKINDENDCLLSDSVFVPSDSLDVTIESTDISCFGANDGVATANPAFDVAPCTFLWDDPLGQITQTASDLAPGDYSVLVTHEDGCAGIQSVTITEPTLLEIDMLTLVDPSCGVANGEIAIEAIGGTIPYMYSVDGGVTFMAAPVFTGLLPGAYTVVVQDANGCLAQENVILENILNIPDIVFSVNVAQGCQTHHVTFTNLSDPTLTATVVWSFGDGTTATGPVVEHSFTEAGTYDIGISITTFDGCTTDSVFTDYITVWPLPEAEFAFTPDDPDMLHPEVAFDNLSVDAESYDWNFGDGAASILIDPTHVYPEIGNRFYPVRLIASTDKGCTDTIVKLVYINEVVNYYIPNSFTPDGDPFNQNFTPVFMTGFIPKDFHFTIFNRWGEIMFESYDHTAGWDGTYGGTLVEDGVYVWSLTFLENGTDRKEQKQGHVTILK